MTQETRLQQKATVAEIRERFDHDVERFSNLLTGQTSVVDASMLMELITEAAVATTASIGHVLDIGCGAGNNTLKLLQAAPHPFHCDLIDLSRPMLERAQARVSQAGAAGITARQGDFRELDLPAGRYDVILAAAVLHHLRDDADWEGAFKKLYRITAPGGGVWITDLVAHENPAVQRSMWQRYGDYLRSLGGETYRDRVFAYIDREDSPRPVTFQLELLRAAGFAQVDLLHKNGCFAAFGALKR